MAEAKDIKAVRKISGAGMMDCKKAILDSNGDIEKAVEDLRKKGLAKATKQMHRQTNVGRVFSYIHTGGSIGVLLQLNCETDFVARNEEFVALGEDLCMQVAAATPLVIHSKELDSKVVEKEKSIYREQIRQEGKKLDMLEKIIEGRIKKFYTEVCLQDQAFIRDPNLKIDDVLRQYISKFGENITIARFERYQVK